MKRSRWVWLKGVLILGLCWCLITSAALADTLNSEAAQSLFTTHCAGCHVNGGNIVRRGKNLKLRALKRHGVDSIAAITTLITNGKGAMSAYGDRLTAEEIDVLAHYVWDKAQTNWK